MVSIPYWAGAGLRSTRIFCPNNYSQFFMYNEIVIEDIYRLRNISKKKKVSLIVDIGANIGTVSKLCSVLFPKAQIYAYEPAPIALTYLKKNAQGTNRIKCYGFAVMQNDGTVFMDISDADLINRVSMNKKYPGQAISAKKVADGKHIDLLKMDCEGSEWSILREPSLLGRTKIFVMEYHLFDDHTLSELKDLIEQGNHRVVDIVTMPKDSLQKKLCYNEIGYLWSELVKK